ncbi:hypothetical protein [Spirosoma rhododendri]|uniref:Uncharacterized protein n=1 Tax=Spirosoma rhododendri TaxID=2728024 RepID=A0A7L5DU58_9BACT|nr:hypothetical protein [Spirosoma rhododendri]QJD79507.1 hypothetical protein HH216_14645 [Spirosoma rhododendri]
MKRHNLLLLGLLMAACSTENSQTSDVPAAPGWGDDYVARRVSGVYLLSTDYHYQYVCNYLPEAFVKNLFKLGNDVELEKHSRLNSCELRWGSNAIGFYLESEKPFESVYQSEYYFNKRFEPQANPIADQGTKPRPTIYGPAPQGTATGPISSTAASPAQDSARGFDPSGPIEGITEPKPALVAPARNTATGRAVTGVGDKAIWEPGKKALHVLYNNHVFSVVARMSGDTTRLKQGSIGLARRVIDMISDDRDPRD